MIEMFCWIRKVSSEWMGMCLYEQVYERWLLKDDEAYVAIDWFGRRGHGNEQAWVKVVELNPGDLFIHTKQ